MRISKAGAATLPTPLGGRGFDAEQAHSIMAPFVEPIAISILVILAGVVIGGVAFLLSAVAQQQAWSSVESLSGEA